MELSPQIITIGGGLLIGLVIGLVGRASRFCTFCAVRDVIRYGDSMRAKSWALAIVVALIGVQIQQITQSIDLSETIYLSDNFGWVGAIIGGVIFGVGMALVGSCGFNLVIRSGAGDMKAIVAMLVMALSAYMAARGITGLARVVLIEPLAIDMSDVGGQGLPGFIGNLTGYEGENLRPIITALIAAALLLWVFSNRQARFSWRFLAPAAVIGSMAIAGFAITGNLGVDEFEPQVVQSVAYIMPSGNSVLYLLTFTGSTIDFGIALIGGTLIGAFLASAFGRDFSVRTFKDSRDTFRNLIGAFFMGLGGVIALGCTFGQGITGVATLSMSSFLATFAIITGATLTVIFSPEEENL